LIAGLIAYNSQKSSHETSIGVTSLKNGEYAWYDNFRYQYNNGSINIVDYKGEGGDLAIPEEINGYPVRIIGEKAFSEKSFSSVTIPNNVTTIEAQAFFGAWDKVNKVPLGTISDVIFGENVTAIGDRAFENNSLSRIIIPNNVTSVGVSAFADNPVTSIKLGANVKLGEEGDNGILGRGTTFNSAYAKNGKKAGTYTRQNISSTTWTTGEIAKKPEINTFTDSRDNNTYKITKIGSKTWMAENLNYAESGECYNNEPANCQKYGKYFTWTEAKKACPSGWHLPSNAEWDALYRFADGNSGTKSPYKSETAGKYLKATKGWNSLDGISGNGEDTYGFAALPGGSYYSGYDHAGNNGYWWSASEYKNDNAYYRFMLRENVAGWNKNSKDLLLNVRCVKD
jgi:uncharacterized protein (TIGR02145 family)